MNKLCIIISLLFVLHISLWGQESCTIMGPHIMQEQDFANDTTSKDSPENQWLRSDSPSKSDTILSNQIQRNISNHDSINSRKGMSPRKMQLSSDSTQRGTVIRGRSLREKADSIVDFASDTVSTDTIYAIDNDTLREIKLQKKEKIDTLQYSTFRPDPNKVVWMALAFPGLGQIYNRKYWKLPIVYAGVAGITYAITWNNRNYNDYSRAYRDLLDDNPNSDSYLDVVPDGYPQSQWKTYLEGKQNSARRYRDLSIIIGVAFYAITVVDAFVDASLADFDVSPDLSMKVKPKLEPQPYTIQPSVGCAMQLNF